MFYKALLLSVSSGFIFINCSYASEDTVYDLDNSCTYISGNLKFYQDDQSVYISPFKPLRETLQQTPYHEVLHEVPLDKIAPFSKTFQNAMHLQDNRQRTAKVTEWPYSLHSQLLIIFPGAKQYGGSGVLVGPHHLLTAAHNVYNYDTKEWAYNIKVRPALDENINPFGEANATKAYTFKNWVSRGSDEYDMALVILDRSVGYETGWSGLLYEPDTKLKNQQITVTGYPVDKGCTQMWSTKCTAERLTSEKIFYGLDSWNIRKGSGSGIWINKMDGPYVLGVHNLGSLSSNNDHNSGVRLSAEKINTVLQWMNATWKINENVSRSLPVVINNFTYNNRMEPVHVSPWQLQQLNVATHQGNTRVQSNLRSMCANDFGVEKNDTGAIRLLCTDLNAQAKFNMGLAYANGRGVARNDDKALQLFRMAANEGNVRAQFGLGLAYANGRGVARNYIKAAEWYRIAADQDDIEAQCNLGCLYMEGDGVERNFSEAARLFMMAANKGNTEAKYNLGLAYAHGRGVEKNDSEAMKWLRESANQGNTGAQSCLKQVYPDSVNVAKDDTQSLERLPESAEHKNCPNVFIHSNNSVFKRVKKSESIDSVADVIAVRDYQQSVITESTYIENGTDKKRTSSD